MYGVKQAYFRTQDLPLFRWDIGKVGFEIATNGIYYAYDTGNVLIFYLVILRFFYRNWTQHPPGRSILHILHQSFFWRSCSIVNVLKRVFRWEQNIWGDDDKEFGIGIGFQDLAEFFTWNLSQYPPSYCLFTLHFKILHRDRYFSRGDS